MKCANCGAEVGDAKFCPECGAALKEGMKAPSKDKQKKKKGFGCATVIFVAVIGLFVLMWLSEMTYSSSTSRITSQSYSLRSSSSQSSNLTMGQKNALRAAGEYLNTLALSHDGLIHQLEYEGYSTEDATYAADNCGADWNEQAAKCAKNYLNTMSFSRSGLIDQLIYEGFTSSQAEYGASANGY